MITAMLLDMELLREWCIVISFSAMNVFGDVLMFLEKISMLGINVMQSGC